MLIINFIRYWSLESGGGIQACGDKRSANSLFEMVWQADGSVALRANNGKYLATKRSGHLFASSETVEENSKYYFYLINRPILVLKCEQGFVGYKAPGSTKLECNKACYETIRVERLEKGVVNFKGILCLFHNTHRAQKNLLWSLNNCSRL